MTLRQMPDLKKLKEERRQCQRELERVDAAIQKLDGARRSAVRNGPAGPWAGSASLGDAIERVLAKAHSPVAIEGIVQQLHKNGYRSDRSQLKSRVNLTLIEDQRFRNSGRGRYALDRSRDAVRAGK